MNFKNFHFWCFCVKLCILIFSESVLGKELGFFALHSVHQDASFELSKMAFSQFFKMFNIRVDPSDLGGSKFQARRRREEGGLSEQDWFSD